MLLSSIEPHAQSANTEILGAQLTQIMDQKSKVIPKMSVIVLVTIAFFLALSLFPDLYSDSGPNLVTVIGFLVTVIVCVSLGSWIALTGEPKHQTHLLVSLLLGSGLAFLLGYIFAVDLAVSSPAWKDLHPSTVYNFSVTINCLLALTAILVVEALAVAIYIMKARRNR
jgi:hypothetical protein